MCADIRRERLLVAFKMKMHSVCVPLNLRLKRETSNKDCLNLKQRNFDAASIFDSCLAVCNWGPKRCWEQKITGKVNNNLFIESDIKTMLTRLLRRQNQTASRRIMLR